MAVSLWENKKHRFCFMCCKAYAYSSELDFCSRVYVTLLSAIVDLNGNFPWWTSGLLNVGLSTNEALRTIRTNDEHSMFINHIPACFTYCSNRSLKTLQFGHNVLWEKLFYFFKKGAEWHCHFVLKIVRFICTVTNP